MTDNVLSIVPQTPPVNNNVVEITYTNNEVEVLEADAFAMTEELPGCLAFWKEQPYEVLCFININSIKKVRVISKCVLQSN